MNNILGICNLHDSPHLGKLTEKHPLGAVTFLGRYGLMDFTLSNFSNSGIDKIAILVEKFSHSVRNHVQDGSVWINNTKTGYQRIFYNENSPSGKFNTDINNILYNKTSFDDCESDYVVIAPIFFLMSIDFRKYIDAHIASKNPISLIYKHCDKANKQFINCDVLSIKDNLVDSLCTNTGVNKVNDISLETFIINRDVFDSLINESRNISALFNLRNLITYCITNHKYNVNALEFDGYVVPILSLQDYTSYSLELLKYTNRNKLFDDDWPIYTTTHNTPPVLYGKDAFVSNCFIANGSIIKGRVVNSILSRDVIVEEGAIVENSIIFTKTVIGKDVKLKNVLVDKKVKINQIKEVTGDESDFTYISYGAKI